MGMMDKMFAGAMAKVDVQDLAAKITAAVHEDLNKRDHAQHAGWGGEGSWFVECLNTECGFTAQGSSGGLEACNAMAVVHLKELKNLD